MLGHLNGWEEIYETSTNIHSYLFDFCRQMKAFRNSKRNHEVMSSIAAAEWYAAIELNIQQID